MKTILLTLLFTAALASAQTNSCTSYQQKVTIYLAADGTADTDPACVAKQGLVTFCSNDDDFSADFTASPFASGNMHPAGKKGNCTKPEKVKACDGTEPCQYKYTATVGPGGGGDPVIIVE